MNRFAIIVENKIDTTEHSNQLKRYYEDVSNHYPGYKVVALYLTPDGDVPSSDTYRAVSYGLVCTVIDKIVNDRRSTLGSEVVTVLQHYTQMLRRHIVSDSEIANLCRRIYSKHQAALNLIFEHRPDQRAQIGQYVKSLVLKVPELDFYDQGRHYINFGLQEWHNSSLYLGEYLDRTWLLYFSFLNMPDSLTVGLWVGPGDNIDREKLLLMAQAHSFMGCRRRLRGKWSYLSSMPVLSASDYEKSQEEIEALISEKWTAFLRREVDRVSA